METVDVKQQELDMLEKQILTDMFGGYEAHNLVYKLGFFKVDLAPRVQRMIQDFEKLVKPFMTDRGLLDTTELKRYVNEDFINLPEGQYHLMDIYRRLQPFLLSIKKYLMR